MKKQNGYLLFVFLIFLSFIPLFDLLHPGLPITHDGQDHVARIANFYQNLTEGNIVPRWAANLNWRYGHPILMFLYPLPSYIASLFHFLGFSLIDSTKLVFGITYMFSGLTMYLWINEFLGKRAAFISALLYLIAPYRFIDLYVRGALGEHVAFIFPPLVCYFLLQLTKKYSYWHIVGGALSLAGLILSHNAISLMFLPIIFLYALFLLWQSKRKWLLIMGYGLVAVLGFGLSAFFWVPAFLEGKYTLRDIVTAGEYASRFADFRNFIFSPWNYGISGQFSVQVGIVQWSMILLSLPITLLLYKKRDKNWIFGAALFLIFGITLFLMIPSSQFIWETLTTLQKFQFPWRLLSVTVFTTAVLGGLVISAIPKKAQFAACFLLLVVLLLVNKDYWHAKDHLKKPESFFKGIYSSTTDTGESSPIWSVRFMEKESEMPMEVISGNALIRQGKRTSTYHQYEIGVITRARIRENTLYFPGWEVLVDGKKVAVEFQDPANRGLVTFFVDGGKHSVEIIFGETRLRLVANLISLANILLLLGIPTLWKKLLAKPMA